MPKVEEEKTTWGSGGLFGSRELGSLLLMLTTPIVGLTMWHTCKNHGGSFTNLYVDFQAHGFNKFWSEVWPTPFDPYSMKMIGCYMVFELILQRFVPGKLFKATPTATGHVPEYIANGIQSYLITLTTLFALYFYGIFDPADVYDNMGTMLSSMNVFAVCLCVFLTIKGRNFPSTKDSGTNGSIIMDFFWGTELYPNILGWDVKQFTNCRFGMMYWQVGIICYAFKQYQNLGHVSSSMVASVLIQTVYIAKFFWWETGYFCSMDIQHDRAGYYICWGCLNWVPSIYTMHTYFLVEHPVYLSQPTTVFFILAGIACIWCNYDCDRQRVEFRATGGKQKVWGKEPAFIRAKYTTKDGSEERESLLLVSGWWALARHFHYIPEIMGSFFWCVPGLFSHPLPFFYPVYLTLLLFDRAWRDDARCADKYGKYWVEYCKKVPSKVIPGVV